MNPKLEPIFGRRSIRRYTSQPVDEEDIQSLLEAAAAAPSARGCYPARFFVITERSLLNSLAEILPYGSMLKEAPLGIIVCGNIEAAHAQSLSYMLQDCSASIENMLLAAHILGLGAVWLGVHPRKERIEGIKNLFKLPESILPVGAISIGHPAEKKESRTMLKPEQIHRNQWL